VQIGWVIGIKSPKHSLHKSCEEGRSSSSDRNPPQIWQRGGYIMSINLERDFINLIIDYFVFI
jgi:hypothetical protein